MPELRILAMVLICAVAVIVLMLVGVALSAMIWRLQAYLLRWQQHNMVE
jgi:NitT/TauT family transport system permease protein